jgi:hypothetical protein
MGAYSHRRCTTCNVVTSRYDRAQRQGAITLHVWIKDARNGEVQVGYNRFYCAAHAPVAEATS